MGLAFLIELFLEVEKTLPMARTNPGQFVRQVRQEMAKVTWPSRKETTLSTTMVFIMVTLAALFFLVVDQLIAWVVKLLFGLGG
ncbi:preprotein translocase subunit SecE [Roseospirillum parvum]|uniref:Protein translocase subunit SecE n=2 Tax=Roseospirillum parvum TaxID=83401 RepID=A0A1G8BDT0_9PROT|nr:preprotein translocase subunit SecE [Roseospirillum parvum]